MSPAMLQMMNQDSFDMNRGFGHGLNATDNQLGPREIPPRRFDPYQDNGGSALAIAHGDAVYFASDTRLVKGYSILSQVQPKHFQLTETVVLLATGMWADICYLKTILEVEISEYKFNQLRDPSLTAVAYLLSKTLYSRRFFPILAFCTLCGISEEGKGVVYSYDCVGGFQPETHTAVGSSGIYILPILDSYVAQNNNQLRKELVPSEIPKICLDALTACAERDINTGDGAVVGVLAAGKPLKLTTYTLRHD